MDRYENISPVKSHLGIQHRTAVNPIGLGRKGIIGGLTQMNIEKRSNVYEITFFLGLVGEVVATFTVDDSFHGPQ